MVGFVFFCWFAGSTYVEAVGVVNSDLSMVAHLLVPFGSELGAYSLPTPSPLRVCSVAQQGFWTLCAVCLWCWADLASYNEMVKVIHSHAFEGVVCPA